MNEVFLQQRLSLREDQGLFRRLSPENYLIDFSSNDYLGFARSKELSEMILEEFSLLQHSTDKINGSSGSRLLTGNSIYAEELEKFVAEYHKAEAGLIFNSGYSANVGLISAVARKGDIIFYDELSHASIYDSVRLSKAESFPFKHNDLTHLEERLIFFRNAATSNASCFIIIESVYSMDGDFASLKEVTALCEKFDAKLIIDEAHATGVFGKNGEGRVVELNLEEKIFARVHTFGKALGCHGAIVLGSKILRDYLINFARPFIYTTALPIHSLIAIKCVYRYLSNSYVNIFKTNTLISLFRDIISASSIAGFVNSFSPIQSFIFGGNEQVRSLALGMQKDGLDVRPILSPTVPKGKERIRICLHAYNTEEEINRLLISLKKNIFLVSKKQFITVV